MAKRPVAKRKPAAKKKAPARRTAAKKKPAARKAPARKVAAKKKPAARKAPARKAAAKKKPAARRAPARKPAARKAVASKPVAKKAPIKRTGKPGAQLTVPLSALIAELADRNDMPKKAAAELMDDFIGLTVQNLKWGHKVRITGLGILQVRKRAARMGRNPQTGEAIQIKASKKVAFRVAKDLKEAVI